MTPTMKKLLDFITLEIDTKGIAPTFDDMLGHMGLKSKSGVHRILTGLEERGKIARMKGRARAIAVVAEGYSGIDCTAQDRAKTNLHAKTALSQIANDMSNGLLSHKHAATRIQQITRTIQI